MVRVSAWAGVAVSRAALRAMGNSRILSRSFRSVWRLGCPAPVAALCTWPATGAGFHCDGSLPVSRIVRKQDPAGCRSEEHTSELQSRPHLVCRLLLEKKKKLHSAHNT